MSGFQRSQIRVHTSIVDAEELVSPGSHVDVVGLPLGSLLVHKSIDRIVRRRTLDETVHNQKERFAQVWRSFLCCGVAFPRMATGLIRTRVYTCKCGESASVLKPGDIADLGH